MDQLFETVCGGVAAPNVAAVCGPRGDSLQSYGDRRVSVTQPTGMANDPQLRDFELDDIASDAYRKKLASRGLGSLGNYCCYSRCTPLAVAKSAAKVTTSSKRHVVGERCIPAPAGGTSVPAKGRPECPAAATVAGGAMSPLVRSEPARAMRSGDMWWVADAKATCCYNVIAVREVEWRDGCDTCRCAAEGTLVRTPTGEVAIEQLVADDVVLSMDGGTLRPVPIARVSRTAATDHVVIAAQLDDGRTVMMSPLHPTADGRRFADLVIGDALGTARIVGVTRVRYGAAFTYDILPGSDSGTYVANGALVGSTLTP